MRKSSKKLLALILAVACLLAAIPFVTAAEDANTSPATLPADIPGYENLAVGKTIIDQNFDGLSALPEGWQYGTAKGTGYWAGSSDKVPYVTDGVLYYDSTSCDALIGMPAIGVKNYVFEAEMFATTAGSHIAIFNDMPASTVIGTNDIKACLNIVATDVWVGNQIAYTLNGMDGTVTSVDSTGFAPAPNKKVNLKVYSIDGTNYFYVDGVFRASYAQSTNNRYAASSILGFFARGRKMGIDNVTVNEITAKELANLEEGKTLYDLASILADTEEGTVPGDWDFGAAGVAENKLPFGRSWGTPGATLKKVGNTLEFSSTTADAIAIGPSVIPSDYIYEVTLKSTKDSNQVGISNGSWGASISDIKSAAYLSSYTRWGYVTKGSWSNVGVANPTETNITDKDTNTIGLKTEHTFKIVCLDGVNYYFIDGAYRGSAAVNNTHSDGTGGRLGIYAYNANMVVSGLTVKAIEGDEDADKIIAVGDGIYFKGEALYDPDFSDFTVGALPEGWAAGYYGGAEPNGTKFGYTAANNTKELEAKVITSSYGKVVEFSGVNGDNFMSLPKIDTVNYVFEATVMVMGTGGALGLANNYYNPANKAAGVQYSSNYFSVWNDSIYTNRTEWSSKEDKWDKSFTLAQGAIVEYKLVSVDGYNYIFVNDELYTSIPWRSATATFDHPGFYNYNSSMYILDTKVSAIEKSNAAVDAANTYITLDNGAVALNSKFAIDKSEAIYQAYINGEYTDDSNVKFGAVVLKADEKAFIDLTAATEGAQVIEATEWNETENTLEYTLTLSDNVAAADYQKWFSIRPFVKVNDTYHYSDGVAYTVANLANSAYANAGADDKAEIKEIFGTYPEFIYKDGVKSITFTAFADLHYKAGTYPASIADLNAILKRADDTNSAFVISAGDMSNDFKGSPELTKAFHGYVTAEGDSLKVYNVYGNHELETGNTMDDVTPTLTNDTNVVWGTADGKMDNSIAHYYMDNGGFRMIFLDNNYDYNPNHYVNEDGSMGDVVGWEHYLRGSWGGTSAAKNATRGFYEGANAAANRDGGSLGDKQMAWLEEVLLDAAANDIPCIVVGHAGYSGLGFGGGASDAAQVRAVYKKANDANPGTVVMSINGHEHANNQGWNEGVFYLDLNTVRNTWWQQNGYVHYGAEHTFKYESYNAQGELQSITDNSYATLDGAEQSWFSADPLSAVITVSDNGIVSIDGTESTWAYGIAPDESKSKLAIGVEPRISSGLFVDCDTYGHVYACTDDGDGYHTCKCANPNCGYDAGKVAHTFDQEVVSDEYKVNDTTYYKSCACGLAGTDTFTVGILGDLNGDEELNVLDLVKLSRIVLGLDQANDLADFNQDGAIDEDDVTALRTTILG